MLKEFVEIAEKREEPFSSICARFGLSRTTGYKWLKRFKVEGPAGLVEQSRRPKNNPRKIPDAVENLVFELRRNYPDWSAATIGEELERRGVSPLPAPSTIDLILRRRREKVAIQVAALGANADVLKFEPNFRWAIRKGREIRLADGSIVQPVAVRDIATHFVLGMALLGVNDREETVRELLQTIFVRYGLPWRIVIPAPQSHTAMSVWLIQLGLGVDFSPEIILARETELQQLAFRLAALPSYQRNGLEERALKLDTFEPLYRTKIMDRAHGAALLDRIREQQNFGGKQEALQKRSPMALYRPSARGCPKELPELCYPPEAEVRLVSEKGILTFKRRLVHIGRVFAGLSVELRPVPMAERYLVLLGGQVLGEVDLSKAEIDDTTSLPLRVM
ncbi:MAG: helix-turn-helix domain-containing protein [Cephaloticoccus sp.]|nr:helix-turn-helix domain-containing protein [Cephaloticoccus sp.]